MIRSIRHKGLRLLYELADRTGVSASRAERLEEMLAMLDVATSPRELNLPGYRLHRLHGDRAGFWSIAVSGNWRLVFRFVGTDVTDVDLVDYH